MTESQTMDKDTDLLSDEEIEAVQKAALTALRSRGFNGSMCGVQWDEAHARAIEQAVLKKVVATTTAAVEQRIAVNNLLMVDDKDSK